MSDRELTEQFTVDLQNIEFVIVEMYREHPELADSNVDRVLDILTRVYTAEANHHIPPPVKLTGNDLELYTRLRAMCEWRAGCGEAPTKTANSRKPEPRTVDEIAACLKRVRSSVKLWNKELGRQGYLNWIITFF